MKKIVTVTDLCCERCARRLADSLKVNENIINAKADYKKNRIFVEVLSAFSDEDLRALVQAEGYEVISIELRKGLFA